MTTSIIAGDVDSSADRVVADARALAVEEWRKAIPLEKDRIDALEYARDVLAHQTASFLNRFEYPLAVRYAAAFVLLNDRHSRVLDARRAALKRRIAAQT